jgi:hypothetical protein
MKVNIGPYKSWVGPYQIAEKLLFWIDKDTDDRVHDFGTWLSGGEAGKSTLLKLCNWIESKRKRKEFVRIDHYDTWSMDSTIAIIILPMLKQLQATKHGAPFVDDADVPHKLRSTSAPAKESEYDIDANHFLRWDYVLGEMIFAFECKVDDSWQDKYHTGTMDIVWKPSEQVDANNKPLSYEMTSGPLDTHKCDYEGMKLEQTRITNGFRLFGKYYENLWD